MPGSALVLVHQQRRGADTPDKAPDETGSIVDEVRAAHSAI